MSEFQKMCIVLKKTFTEVRGERKGAYKVLLGKSEGQRPLGRPGRRWEDNVELSLLKWVEDMESFDLAQDRDRFHKMRGIS